MRRFSRFGGVTVALLVVLSGCGSEVIEPTTANPGSPATIASPSTTAEVGPLESTNTTIQGSSTTRLRPPLIDGPLAPYLTFELDDHSTVSLSEVYEPVVLFFWATWCHNCHEMMPAIDQMSADYAGRATVVAVARLSASHEIENDVIEYLPSGATRWMSDDDNSITEAFRVPGNPVSILVVGGVEADRWLGSTPVTDIRQRLDEVLGLYG